MSGEERGQVLNVQRSSGGGCSAGYPGSPFDFLHIADNVNPRHGRVSGVETCPGPWAEQEAAAGPWP